MGAKRMGIAPQGQAADPDRSLRIPPRQGGSILSDRKRHCLALFLDVLCGGALFRNLDVRGDRRVNDLDASRKHHETITSRSENKARHCPTQRLIDGWR